MFHSNYLHKYALNIKGHNGIGYILQIVLYLKDPIARDMINKEKDHPSDKQGMNVHRFCYFSFSGSQKPSNLCISTSKTRITLVEQHMDKLIALLTSINPDKRE